MIALITAILPVALQLVGWFLGKTAASDELKKRFLALVSQFESESGTAVRLNDSVRLQLEKLKAESAKNDPPLKPFT